MKALIITYASEAEAQNGISVDMKESVKGCIGILTEFVDLKLRKSGMKTGRSYAGE